MGLKDLEQKISNLWLYLLKGYIVFGTKMSFSKFNTHQKGKIISYTRVW